MPQYEVNAEALLPLLENAAVAQQSHKLDMVLYLLFFLEGIGCLFPWNAFITVTSYFSEKFKDSPYENNFENYFTFSYQAINIIALAIAMRYQQRIPLKLRVVAPLVIQTAVFVMVFLQVKTLDMSQDIFFATTLTWTLICGAATAFLQGGLFGLAGVLPSAYVNALMGGQGLGGVIVAALNVLTLGVSSGDPDQAAMVFFSISLALLLLCLAGFFYLYAHPLVQERMTSAAQSRIQSRTASHAATPVKSVNGRRKKLMKRTRSYLIAEDDLADAINMAKHPMIMVFLVFSVTLSVFPALGASIKSTTHANDWADTYFVPVSCFVMFNVGDLIGRMTTNWYPWPVKENHKRLTIPVLLRFAFIPLFLLCNVYISSVDGGSELPHVFTHDAWPTAFMLLVGISNGYLATMCMMIAPSLVPHGDAEAIGSLSVFCLTLGLLAGTLIGFGLKALLCFCNPFS